MALEGSSHADGARAAPPLQVDLRLGLPIIAAGIGVTALVAALEPEHAECRWCERSDLNPVDDWFRERFTSDDPAALEPILGAATGLSLLGTLGVYVASARHAGADWASVAQDGIVMVEAVSVTLALTALAKVAFARQRPYALAADLLGTLRGGAARGSQRRLVGNWACNPAAASTIRFYAVLHGACSIREGEGSIVGLGHGDLVALRRAGAHVLSPLVSLEPALEGSERRTLSGTGVAASAARGSATVFARELDVDAASHALLTRLLPDLVTVRAQPSCATASLAPTLSALAFACASPALGAAAVASRLGDALVLQVIQSHLACGPAPALLRSLLRSADRSSHGVDPSLARASLDGERARSAREHVTLRVSVPLFVARRRAARAISHPLAYAHRGRATAPRRGTAARRRGARRVRVRSRLQQSLQALDGQRAWRLSPGRADIVDQPCARCSSRAQRQRQLLPGARSRAGGAMACSPTR